MAATNFQWGKVGGAKKRQHHSKENQKLYHKGALGFISCCCPRKKIAGEFTYGIADGIGGDVTVLSFLLHALSSIS